MHGRREKNVCSFSSRGPEVELAAPGYQIDSTWHTSDTAYATQSGTSMSTPHVAGAAALVKASRPLLSNSQIRSELAASAEDRGSPGRDRDYGYGIPKPHKAMVNGAPVIETPSCSPSPAATSRTVSCALVATDVDSSGVSYLVDWGDGSPVERHPASGHATPGRPVAATHKFAAPGTYSVRANATDDAVDFLTSQTKTASLAIVANRAPAVGPVACGPNPSMIGQAVACSFSAADDSDGLAFTVDWGDGSPPARVPATGVVAPGPGSASYAYPAVGNHTVTVTATDDADPALTSAPRASPLQQVIPCILVRTGSLHSGAAGVAVEGVTAKTEVDLPPSCSNQPYRLSGSLETDDFDVCWFKNGLSRGCHTARGPVQEGVVPDDVNSARVLYYTGAAGRYELRIPPALGGGGTPEPDDRTLVLRDDDGTREAIVKVDYSDDTAIKYVQIPGSLAPAIDKIESATLWVYAQSSECGQSGDSHAIDLNHQRFARFNACSAFPSGEWTWVAFPVPRELLLAGASATGFTNGFSIEKVAGVNWSTRNLNVGIDTSRDTGRSNARMNGSDVPGELMVYLVIVKSA